MSRHADEHDAMLRRPRETADDLPLFAAPRARNSDPATSHAAAASMVTGAQVQRGLIVRLLMSHGPHTNDEIDLAFAWRTGTASKRTAELLEDRSLVVTGETRRTATGRAARVLMVARHVEAAA